MRKKIIPPIKYYGGKGGMLGKILEQFPREYNIYIEPFAGSFSVGLSQNSPIEIYNDLDKNVYCLYKVISDTRLFEKFKFKTDLYPYSEDLRKEFMTKLKWNNDIDDVDRAFYFFYVNRTSHNGQGGFSTSITPRRNMSKSVSDYLSAVDRLEELHQRLSKVIILNRDALSVIEKYNEPNIFLYCDPPYHHSTRTSARYPVDFNNDKQIEFLDSVNNSNSKILISGYDNEIYDRYLKNWNKISFKVKTMSGNYKKKIKTEYLWRNYKETVNQLDTFQF